MVVLHHLASPNYATMQSSFIYGQLNRGIRKFPVLMPHLTKRDRAASRISTEVSLLTMADQQTRADI